MANKRYDQFTQANPTGSRIILHADPTTGALNKCTIDDEFALLPGAVNMPTIFQALGSPIKGITGFQPVPHQLAASNMANQVLYLAAVYLPAGTMTGITWMCNVPGNYTANNYNGVGLYSYSAPNATLIASSTNNGNVWKSSGNGNYQVPFTTPIVITAGVYFTAYLYCSSAQVTAPQPFTYNTYTGAAMNSWFMLNNARIFGSINSQTGFPSPINFSTSTINITNGFVTAVY